MRISFLELHAGLDLTQLYLATATVFLGLMVALAIAWRELRGMPGLDRFAASFALIAGGTALLAARGRIPDLLSIVAGNTAVVLGACLVQEGTRHFYGARPQRLLTLISSGGSCVGFLYFTYIDPSVMLRTFLSNGLLAFHLGQAAATSWRGRGRAEEERLDRVTSLALAAGASVFAIRTLLTIEAVRVSPIAGDVAGMAALYVAMLAGVVWTTALLANANRRLTAEIGQQKDLLASLLLVARVATDGPSLDDTLRRTLELASSLTGATGSSLFLVDESGAFSRGLFSAGSQALVVAPDAAERLIKKGLAGWVARERASALVTDTRADPRWFSLDAQAEEIRSALSVPIKSGAALAGMLTLVHGEAGHFRAEHQRLIESSVAQIALVLRNAQIADARLRATRHQALLNRVLGIAARRVAAPEIAAAAADAIAQSANWLHVVVALPGEGGSFKLLGHAGGLGGVELEIGAGIIGRAYATERSQLVSDARRDPDYVSSGTAAGSELAVPLRHAGRVLGVLNIESPLTDGFTPGNVELAEGLAEAIALGLENARLLADQQDLTHALVHDLRAPMVSVMGALRLISRSSDASVEDQKLLDMAKRNAERQLELIEAILEVGRLESGAIPLRPARVRLAELAADVLKLATPRALNRGIPLASQVPVDLPAAWADRELIARVLENLVSNAIKFSPQGAGPVDVSGWRLGLGRVALRVSDTGPGIAAAQRARLFHKFARGDERERGSGLGLAFCRLAVEASGGRIWLDETHAPGAAFVLSLPVAGEEKATASASLPGPD